ncbi:MAG: transglutaminaseTgpA domain-containing protein [Verrucomicrobiota bacterium]
MTKVSQMTVAMIAAVMGYFLRDGAGLVFLAAGALVALGATFQWLTGTRSVSLGFFAFAVGVVTGLATLAGGKDVGVPGLLTGGLVLAAAMGSLTKGRSRRGLVELEGDKRGWRSMAVGAVLALAAVTILLAFALPLWSSGVLALAKPVSYSARPYVASTVNEIQSWLEGQLPWFSKSPEEEKSEETVSEPFDGSHEVLGNGALDLSDDLRVALRFQNDEGFGAISSGPVYVRSRVFDEFDGRLWTASEDEMEFFGDTDDGVEDGWTRVAVSMPEAGTLDYEVFMVGSQGTELPALADVTAFGLGSVVAGIPGWYRGGVAGDVHYRARSVPAGELIPVTGVDVEKYLDDGGGQGLRELRLIAAGIEDPRADERENLGRIADYLRRHCEYSLIVENPDGLSPMENFLSGTKTGYCDHFATAAVLMARVQGVPARMVMGYSGGVVDDSQRMVAFAERDAHAWAEVLLDGRWTIFDTTPVAPGAQGGAREAPSFGDRQFASASPALETAEDASADSEPPPETTRTENEGFFARWGDWVLRGAGLLLLSLVLLRWVFPWIGGNLDERRKERAARGGRVDGFDRDEALPGYLKEFFRLMDQVEVFRPAGATVRESVGAMKEAGWHKPVLEELAAYHYEASYADRERHTGLERKFRQEIRALAKRRSRESR